MTFDGSCDPNPRGRMGWSYIITLADGRTVQGRGELPPGSDNTVNVAEYRGLIDGLRAYLAEGRRGPLRVTGDSQLIVNQVNGSWKVRNAALAGLHALVGPLARQIQGFELRWNPREQNADADRLARGAPAPDPGGAPDPADRYLADPLQAGLPADLAASIRRINASPAPGFGDFSRLRTGGLDAFSRLGLEALRRRAGPEAADAVAAELSDEKAQATALRWALRGLGLRRSVRKVRVDEEISKRSRK
ncbi:MAG TPA: reverse transcriptase-like protein [Roseiflexaceae bacterium]|nr:reverse transcriptase-like protein [Roseiflexaceae bacterium]